MNSRGSTEVSTGSEKKIIGEKELQDELKRKYRGEYRKWDKLRENHWRETVRGCTKEEVKR